MLNIIQKGHGDRRLLVVAWFIANNAALLRNLPDSACVITDNDDSGGRFSRPVGHGGVDSLETILARARSAAGPFEVEATILIGWSAGGQALREQLRSGARPEVVIELDGASGSVPPTHDQLDPWQQAAARARRGEMLFVMTCTQLTYTRALPPAERFEATVYVATEVATGSRPLSPSELLTPGEYPDGSFLVAVHASGSMDGEAHKREQNLHLPDLLARVVRPWLLGRTPTVAPPSPDTTADPPAVPPAAPTTLPTGSRPHRDVKALQRSLNEHGASPPLDVDGIVGPLTRAALWAFQRAHGLLPTGVADVTTWEALEAPVEPDAPAGDEPTVPMSVGLLAVERLRGEVGVHETPGPGATPRVVEYGKGAIRRGHVLDLGNDDTPAWCCVLQGWAEEGLPGAMVKRWAVAEAWADAVANGTARPREYKAKAGDLAVFSRGGDPRRGGQGHVARVVEDVDENGDYPAIGGNEGGAAHFGGEVLLTKRNTSDPTLVGWIVRST